MDAIRTVVDTNIPLLGYGENEHLSVLFCDADVQTCMWLSS